MCANAWIKTYSFNDGFWVEPLNLSVSIKFVKVADAKGKVSIGEKFYSLCFLHTHKESVDVFFDGTFLQKCCESLSCFNQHINISYRFDSFVLCLKLWLVDNLRVTNNDTAWIEVIVEGFALTKELGREEEVELLYSFLCVLQIKVASVANRYGWFDDHDSIGIYLQHQVNHFFHMSSVEVVLYWVIIGRSCYDYEICILVGWFSIKCSNKI